MASVEVRWCPFGVRIEPVLCDEVTPEAGIIPSPGEGIAGARLEAVSLPTTEVDRQPVAFGPTV